MVNRRGPSTEPWGTPWWTGVGGEFEPLMETNCFLLWREDVKDLKCLEVIICNLMSLFKIS